jgi:hypothetical protein
MNVNFKDVRRKQFDEIANKIEEDEELKSPVTLYYSGTNLFGSLSIECVGNSKAFNKALQIATEVITRVRA